MTEPDRPSSSMSDYNDDNTHHLVKKHRGTISTLLSYKGGPSFRDDGVIDKPNKLPAKVVQVCLK